MSCIATFYAVRHVNQSYQVCIRCPLTTISPCQPRWCVSTYRPGNSHPVFPTTNHPVQTTGVPGPGKCTSILAPLNALLKTTPTNSRTLHWNPAATSSFQEIKQALVKAILPSQTVIHPVKCVTWISFPSLPLTFVTLLHKAIQSLML